MSRFLQLRDLKKAQDDSIREYWHDLQGMAGVIWRGFSDYLQLPHEVYLDENREETPYVRIAKKVGGEYKYVMLHELPGQDLFLEFSIGLTLDRDVNTYPKQTIFTSLRMKKEGGGYLVVSPENNLTIKISDAGGGFDFSELYAALFELLQAHFSIKI
ncbi:hypothetical protein CLU80_0010 [Pseudomonas sp. 29]|uniref:hypothetical protein n=1 Tax=Pseudomonas sp. 29 TaxID=2035197 RepID=UPI000C18A344|nr:hypothetical protein [Pseudomonas sp. 29]PIF47790.1 hypothetical protein CLU80_0010 [Pseudomonas sp. 29]